jgi:hypothetical protein
MSVGSVRNVLLLVENPEAFGVSDHILRDIGAELFKTHNAEIFPGEQRGMYP